MKKLIFIASPVLFFAALFITGCGNFMSEKDLMCGTANGSKNGYKMHIRTIRERGKGDQTIAYVTTQYVMEMPRAQKVYIDYGDLDIKKVLSDSAVMDVDSFRHITWHTIKLPDDGKTYWFVPFDPNDVPWPARMSAAAIGCCCGEGDGCYADEHGGCSTKVCASSCTNTFVVFDGNNKPTLRSVNKGYAIVQADNIEYNGVKMK